MNVILIWQSLVVSAYRSFWIHFSNALNGRLTAVVPHEFWELGGQMVPCAPFSDEWQKSIETHVLKVRAPHIQMVWFDGLSRVFRHVARQKSKVSPLQERSQPIVLIALMEPYSLSALLVYILAQIFLPRGTHILFYSLQNIYKEFSFPLRFIQTFIFKRTPRILALSAEVSEVLRRQGYTGQIIRFPLWADSSLFYLHGDQQDVGSPTNLSSLEKIQAKIVQRTRVGFCGAVTESKGIPDLISALELMSSQELSAIHFEVAGGGPVLASLRMRLDALIPRGLTYKLHGPVPATVLPQFFNSIDVLVVPSRTESHWKEQFGRVIVEAWACGATVIGSNSGEIPVLLADSELIFEERNPHSLASVLRGILKRENTIELRQQNAFKARPYLDVTLAQQFVQEVVCLSHSN